MEILKNRKTQILVFLFITIIVWRVSLIFIPSDSGLYWWGALYQIIALYGAIFGFAIAQKWGGFKSAMGRTVLAFSSGLLLQSFGQATSSYYVYTTGTVPYPAIGDIGFFGSVLFYITGIILLSRASNIQSVFKSISHKIRIVIFPLIMLSVSYWVFLNNYVFDWSNKVKVFLDFGYPLGQAFYVSVAILLLISTKKMWGGVMRKPIFLLLIALVTQYTSDFMFLYQSNNNTYVGGGSVDCMYFVSYFLMAFSLIYLSNVFHKIQSESFQTDTVKPESGVMTGIDKLLNQILIEIIKRQEKVAGNLAWEEVKKVQTINIVDQTNFVVSVNGDVRKAIDQLVLGFKNLFGDIAVGVSKNAVRYLTAELPPDEVPSSLK